MARAGSSPLSLLLAVFCFAAHVLAVPAVLGIDLGTEYIKAALVKPGIPLEIVLTKDSRRKEISAIAFKPPSNGAPPRPDTYPERLSGSDAMALAARFPGDVYPNLKALLGIQADSVQAKEYASRHPALKMEAHRLRGTAAFRSGSGLAFAPEEDAWMVEELLAMELQGVRANAEALAGGQVRSVVLTVPPFYTAEERRAVELAADLAGLRVLSLVSDGLAVGINYATSRQFPNVNEGGKPEHHLVFDMGAGSTKATVVRFQSRTVKDVGKFNKTVQEVQVVGAGWDRTLGGDALNYLVVDDMLAQFLDSPKAKQAGIAAEDVRAHGRAIAKLTKDAERLRHVLSANQNTQTSFEGLYEDIDFKYKITRADYEALIEAQVARVAGPVQRALDTAGLGVADLDSVILHGGASRTPFVQRELEKLLGGGDKVRTNVNADEAAVFGAGFRAAAISPSFRVKEIRVADAAGHAAGVRWETAGGKAKHQQLFVPTSQVGAPAKEVTFPNREDFAATFYQVVPAQAGDAADGATVEAETKVFTTKNLTATAAELASKYACETKDMHLKASVRLAAENGEVDVVKATLECETDEPEKETLMDGVKNLFGFGKSKDGEQKVLAEDETADSSSGSAPGSSSSTSSSSSGSSSSSTAAAASAASSAAAASSVTKRTVGIPVSFTLEAAGIPQLPKADLAAVKTRIKAFEASDHSRREREEARNELELYAYKAREVIDNEAFVAYSTAAERAALGQKSSETSDWMYGDGAEASREEIKARLKELQDIAAPVERRFEEAKQRPALVEGLQDRLKKTQEFLDSVVELINEYDNVMSVMSSMSAAMSQKTDGGGDFDGLEDDTTTALKAATTGKPRDMDDVSAERGPVPPLYTLDDLRESEQLQAEYAAWLDAKLAEQAKLAATDDPVLLVEDLLARQERLDRATMELTTMAARKFEGKQKKKSSSSSSSSSSSKSKKGGKSDNIPPYIEEELEGILRRLRKEQADAEAAAKTNEAKAENSKAENKEKKEAEQPAGEKRGGEEGAGEAKKAGQREHEEL